MRDTLLNGFQRIGLGNEIPEVISGHAGGGTPTRAPYLAGRPLPFVGFAYEDDRAMGLALIPTQDSTILGTRDFRKVLRKLAPLDEDRERRVLTLATREGTPPDRAFLNRSFPHLCDLICEGRAPLELVHPDRATETIALDRATAFPTYAGSPVSSADRPRSPGPSHASG